MSSPLYPCPLPSYLQEVGRGNYNSYNNQVVGVVEAKGLTVFKLQFLDSDVFWDESDYFAEEGHSIMVYHLDGLANYQVGDKVQLHISGSYWDGKTPKEIEECFWTYRVFVADSIQPARFSAKIFAIDAIQWGYMSGFYLVLFGAVCVTLGVVGTQLSRRFFSKKKKK